MTRYKIHFEMLKFENPNFHQKHNTETKKNVYLILLIYNIILFISIFFVSKSFLFQYFFLILHRILTKIPIFNKTKLCKSFLEESPRSVN